MPVAEDCVAGAEEDEEEDEEVAGDVDKSGRAGWDVEEEQATSTADDMTRTNGAMMRFIRFALLLLWRRHS